MSIDRGTIALHRPNAKCQASLCNRRQSRARKCTGLGCPV